MPAKMNADMYVYMYNNFKCIYEELICKNR